MSRPYVICHMMSSVDGRILVQQWGSKSITTKYSAIYEETADTHEGDAWLCGRVTMEEGFASKKPLKLKPVKQAIKRIDFIAPYKEASFAVAIDKSGKLNWDDSAINGDHLITVLSESVSDEYLASLQKKGISYLFGGKKEINFNKVFEKLSSQFKIKRLLIEGGGHINGSILKAGLIDELSLLICPAVDGADNTPSSLDVKKSLGVPLKLVSVEQMKHDVLWLKYKVVK
jgi:2,5-diamino-6-(ribosylamino)-4(3H)-pyrimidinone 5'-phosphate reductase